MKMTTTPPASWTGNVFRRPPLGVYTVTGSPEDAVMRCLDLWVTIGVREYTHGMPQQFALRGWVGMEITVDASSTATKMSSLDFPDLMGAVSDAVSVAVSGTGTLLHMAYEATAPEGLRAVTDTVGEVAGFVGSVRGGNQRREQSRRTRVGLRFQNLAQGTPTEARQMPHRGRGPRAPRSGEGSCAAVVFPQS